MSWKIFNPDGKVRVLVTTDFPGEKWLDILIATNLRVDVYSGDKISADEIKRAFEGGAGGVIGQLTTPWDEDLLSALKKAGGLVYSNYAVGLDNVDIASATKLGLAVGNTPGVLTETTAELAAALTLSAGRMIVEADKFMRSGRFDGWLPGLFLGLLFQGKTVGVIGVGRIGQAYAKMMVEGFKMNLIYLSRNPKPELEGYMNAYSGFLTSQGHEPLFCRQADSVEDLLENSDLVALHTPLTDDTRHLMNAERLAIMKENAILINTSRGLVIDESALVAHCQKHPHFRAGLDVFEDEPAMKPGLAELENVVLAPHIGSSSSWTRDWMGALAAFNVAGILSGYPAWGLEDIKLFLTDQSPKAVPSIVNAAELGLEITTSV